MALDQVFTVSENAAGTSMFDTDGTGSYDVTNVGGYGAPNTERTDLAIIAITKARESSGNTEITAVAYDPETVVIITYNSITIQGRYTFDNYTIPRSGTEATATNNFRYDFATDLLERYNGSSWVTAANSELETYSGTNNVIVKTVEYLHIPDMFMALNRLMKLIALGCQQRNQTDLKRYANEIDERINTALTLFTDTDYTQAQSIVENYADRTAYINSLT